jgi:hypothetical protein
MCLSYAFLLLFNGLWGVGILCCLHPVAFSILLCEHLVIQPSLWCQNLVDISSGGVMASYTHHSFVRKLRTGFRENKETFSVRMLSVSLNVDRCFELRYMAVPDSTDCNAMVFSRLTSFTQSLHTVRMVRTIPMGESGI